MARGRKQLSGLESFFRFSRRAAKGVPAAKSSQCGQHLKPEDLYSESGDGVWHAVLIPLPAPLICTCHRHGNAIVCSFFFGEIRTIMATNPAHSRYFLFQPVDTQPGFLTFTVRHGKIHHAIFVGKPGHPTIIEDSLYIILYHL